VRTRRARRNAAHRARPNAAVRRRVALLISTPAFEALILLLIIINGILIGIQTYDPVNAVMEDTLDKVGMCCMYIFLSEVLLKCVAYGPITYLSDAWNFFDFAIVLLTFEGSRQLSVFRLFRLLKIFRIFRVLRLIKRIEPLHKIVSGLIKVRTRSLPPPSSATSEKETDDDCSANRPRALNRASLTCAATARRRARRTKNALDSCLSCANRRCRRSCGS